MGRLALSHCSDARITPILFTGTPASHSHLNQYGNSFLHREDRYTLALHPTKTWSDPLNLPPTATVAWLIEEARCFKSEEEGSSSGAQSSSAFPHGERGHLLHRQVAQRRAVSAGDLSEAAQKPIKYQQGEPPPMGRSQGRQRFNRLCKCLLLLPALSLPGSIPAG